MKHSISKTIFNKEVLLLLMIFLNTFCFSYASIDGNLKTDSLANTSSDSLLIEEEDSPLMFAKNQPHFKECSGIETNLERDQCTKALINEKIVANFTVPNFKKGKKINGIIHVQFVVTKYGTINNVRIIKGINKKLNKEAIRVIKELPKMIPGRNLNKNVSVMYTIPIRIQL